MQKLGLLLLLALCAPLAARAQSSCSGVQHVTWPAVDPVWEFCYQRPSETQFLQNGAGLRIYDVRYRGIPVLRDGSIPVLNVQYNAGGCGGTNLCYRDWFDEEQRFQCAPETPSGSGHCTGTSTPVATVCANPGSDFGSFTGVAVVDQGTSLKLTAQARAGWYRYIPTWEFFPDGTLQPGMDISSVDHPCVAYTHRHHAYFRLDIDLDGPDGDRVTRLSPGSPQLLTSEQSFVDTGDERTRWRIESAGSNATIEVRRNAHDGVADGFSVADGWLLAYQADELDDGPHGTSQCPIDLDDYLNGESVEDTDIVLWVHSMALHEGEPGGLAQDCSMFGPTLKVSLPTCGDGVVEPGEACDDGNLVAGDCCSDTCQHEAAGSACDDGDACSAGDACDAAGLCLAGAPLVCDDGLFCNGAETCDSLAGCLPGTPVDCDDALACTADACDETSDACGHTPSDALCDDALACTDDRCDEALGCQNVETCPDGFGCGTAGSCEPSPLWLEFQGGVGGYAGAEDTFLAEATPDAVYGAEPAVEWDADDPAGSGLDRVGLLRFDGLVGSGPGQIPPGAIVTAATLTLEVFNPSVGSAGSLHESLVAWSGATTTWNDFGGDPGLQADEIGPFVASAPLLAGTAAIDVTASVRRWVEEPGTNHGWIVIPASTNNLHVRSSEYSVDAERPRLSVEVLDVECLEDVDCDDQDECTADRCDAGGACVHEPLAGCAPPIPTGSPPGLVLLALGLLALGAAVALRYGSPRP